MQGIAQVVAIAILIEALVEYAKQVRKQPILIATIVTGIIIAFLFNVTVFQLIGLNTYLYADVVLTGIILSRGSNYIYDLIGKMTGGHAKQIEITDNSDIIK